MVTVCPRLQRLLLERQGWTLDNLKKMLAWGPDHAPKIRDTIGRKRSGLSQRLSSLERLSNLKGLLKVCAP